MKRTRRIIQVPVDEQLLTALDAFSKASGTSRAAVIRRACREYLRRAHEAQLDDEYERGYREHPEDAALGDAQAAVAGEVLPSEDW